LTRILSNVTHMQAHLLSNVTRGAWPLGPDFHRGGGGVYTLWDTLTGQGLTCADPSLGTGSDSFWEYLLKSHLMMPNHAPHLYVHVYRKLAQQLAHEAAAAAVEEQQFIFKYKGGLHVSHIAGKRLHEHLGCYIPGLLMLGAATLADRQGSSDMDTAKRLLDGCLWTYVVKCSRASNEYIVAAFRDVVSLPNELILSKN
jgi:hypothetical protein